ncbi:uncharacterized protein LOC116029864 [Ipomoea triloba]|uniref:uncharacterized protein LOC116029864 n=1 Tax=Ipomoea triloba TaxID=35885 RepID=UPI00125D0088|nr:uncharacterized protein LOC116029864 [Ipomoea triloba]
MAVIFISLHQDAGAVVDGARSYLEAWTRIHESIITPSSQNDLSCWRKPPPGWVKLNVDAAINKGLNSTGLGFILCNEDGNFLAAKEQKWSEEIGPTRFTSEAEAIRIREALKWIKVMNVDRVQIETDALLVIQGLNNPKLISSFDLVLEDIRKLANDFQCISFMFVKRSANTTAHLLAREAVFIADCIIWASLPPSFLYDVLTLDNEI